MIRALRRLLAPPPATPPPGSPRRLHWGCGRVIAKGWINSDLFEGPGIDLVADLRRGLPLADGSVEAIASHHALVMLSVQELVPGLEELRRVLQPGGVLRLGLPDLDRALAAYREGNRAYFGLIPDKSARTLSGKLVHLVLWNGHNRTPFTFEWTAELLERAGFREVVRREFGVSPVPGLASLDTRPEESFFVEAAR